MQANESGQGGLRVGYWSRRRFLCTLTLVGGGIFLTACGGTPPTATPPPPGVPTPGAPTVTATQAAATATTAPASPTRPAPPATPASTPAGTPVGTPVSGTPTRPAPPGSPVAASPTVAPTPRSNPIFTRMLGLVPQRDPLPGADGIWFADIAAQKRNYGFADVTTQEAFTGLDAGKRLTFQNAIMLALPIADDAGRNNALLPEWREATGYDFWQIDRTIQAGSPPQLWTRLEGRFDRAAIATALEAAGHQPVNYGGGTILARGQDGQIVRMQEPFGRLTLARLNRVVLEDAALATTSQMALAEAGIDVRSGQLPSLAADPDYAALEVALGPVVGAIMTKPDVFYGTPGASTRPTPTPTPSRTATPVANRLPPYSRVGLGLRDNGREHAMVIALVYANLDDARTAATVLLNRLGEYRLTVNGQQLSERAQSDGAELVTIGDRTVVVTPLKISDEPSLSLWLRMYTNRDYQFLAP